MAENDAVYRGTGKRKTSVARVILTPGSGAFTVNGRALDEYFGRPTLRTTATSPLELTGLRDRFDVRALCDGGGVTGQAGALRHGIARALIEADPELRVALKQPEIEKRMTEFGLDVETSTPAEVSQRMTTDFRRWKEILDAIGYKVPN